MGIRRQFRVRFVVSSFTCAALITASAFAQQLPEAEHRADTPPESTYRVDPNAPPEPHDRTVTTPRVRSESIDPGSATPGTNGDIFMTSPSPYTTTGVLLLAKPTWPNIAAKLGTADGASSFAVVNSSDVRVMTVLSDGRVGIGTQSPFGRLDVRGAASGGVFPGTPTTISIGDTNPPSASATGAGIAFNARYYSTTQDVTTIAAISAVRENTQEGNYAGALTFGTRVSGSSGGSMERMRLTSSGSLGIGTPGPVSKLDINGAVLAAPSADVAAWGSQVFRGSDDWKGIIWTDGADNARKALRYDQVNGNLVFSDFTTGNVHYNERVVFDKNGNVGIGTASPAFRLHVIGNTKITGTIDVGGITSATAIKAAYQDVAEWVPAATDLAPGTVVILNAEKANEVMASHEAYDTSVAGVVSAQPGVILGTADATKEMIATTGRVKVRVDARQSPIRIGDLLVTSDLPGTAMRSEPMLLNGRKFHQPGTIIGKALEPMESGVGEILVLLSMQ